MKANIVGEFDILPMSTLGHKVTGIQLKVCRRKKPTPQKPEFFLLLVTPSGKRTFISSLYPTPSNKPENNLQTYFLDYLGIDYTLTQNLTTGLAQISPRSNTSQNCANSNNIAQLGSKSDPK